MTEERKKELREYFKQTPKNWIKLFNEKKINAEEIKFMSEKWMEMKGKPMSVDRQAELLAKSFNGEIID